MTHWFGHDAQIATLLSALVGDRLHHGWIFAGPRGVGKAGIALDFARRLLVSGAGGSVPSDQLAPAGAHMALHLLDKDSHPDFMRLERLEKTEPKSGTTSLARNISVDQVRSLGRLFATAPSLGRYRVVLIDSADDLEQGAANALLKSLEEPPRDVIFLLISHAPGRLLPTIRSRCRMLRFNALNDADMSEALDAILPDVPAPVRAALMRGADGAPGAALAMQALDVAELLAALDRIAQGGSQANAARAKLVAALSPIGARARLEAFVDLLPRYIGALARQASSETRAAHLAAWDESRRIADKAIAPYQLEPGALVYMLCDTLSGLGRPALQR